MNAFDRDNLNFLLTASKEDLEDWHCHATPEDYDYAIGLIRAARTELELQEHEVLDTEIETADDCDDARAVLAKFQLQ